ncbi:MAG: DNA mismatch repair protein MutS [Myxococcota bacterium]
MMRQFLEIKARHPDSLLFYRMGDFYELFLDDAERAAPLLDIALTTRDKNKADPVPMCGVPVHAAEQHIQRLASLGHRIAICEQVENPAEAGGRRLVKRDVVEVVTPGLPGDPVGLEATRELSLVALYQGSSLGVATLDASTGDLRATTLPAGTDPAELPAPLVDELLRIGPREVLHGDSQEALLGGLAEQLPKAALTRVPLEDFEPAGAPASPEGFDAGAVDAASRAAAALLAYVGRHQPFALGHIRCLRVYELSETMILDEATCGHLELFRNAEDGSRMHTLLERMDLTRTPLGARRMARWLAYPLLDPVAIRQRQEAVTHLVERDRPRGRLRDALGPVRDLERLLARAARPTATPRDLVALRGSLEALPGLAPALAGTEAELLPARDLPEALPLPVPVEKAACLLAEALVDEPPALPRGSRGAQETGFVRAGFDLDLDALRDGVGIGRERIASLELSERERTGIASLKARFHPVHGYSFEVSKSQLSRVPEHYERKQTLANAERYTTPELREAEQQVQGGTGRAAAMEREIFERVRVAALTHSAAIGAAAEAVAQLDALAALAEVARRDGWVCPSVDASDRLEIRAGRHPVIEPLLAGRGGDGFVPNDAELQASGRQLLILTGPNMSGKSTYLRQVALCVLLAQVGSYVPAELAHVGVVDRIFTRVGASDRLARGESTFMVEMRETAQILAQATPRSLIILDEIGRGTSTFDGLSIAWAVAEYLHDTPGLGSRTLFATHYHELTELALTKPRVANAHFAVREWGEDVVFLRRLAEGGASRSYGIQVARLAGLPGDVVVRAREILANLEGGEFDERGRPRLAGGSADPSPDAQLGLFAPAPAHAAVLERLRELEPEAMTPLEALAVLAELRGELIEEER